MLLFSIKYFSLRMDKLKLIDCNDGKTNSIPVILVTKTAM